MRNHNIHSKKLRRFSSKKSEMGFIVTMILILFAGLILVIAITQFSKKAGLEGAIQSCRFSVLAQAYTEAKPSTSGWESPLDIECNTRYVTFKNTEVLAGFDPDVQKPLDVFYNDKKVQKFGNLNEEIVNQVVAEEMRICWFQFAEGQINVFPNNEKWFQSDDDICFVCSHISFDVPQDTLYDGLYEFMSKTTIQKEGKTYLAYLSAPSKSDATWDEFTKSDSTEMKTIYGDDYTFDKLNDRMALNTKLPYAVVFRRDYDSNGVFGVISENLDNYYIFVIPDTKINEVCDLMAS